MGQPMPVRVRPTAPMNTLESREVDASLGHRSRAKRRSDESRSFAEPVLSGRVPSNGREQILRFAQDDNVGAKGSG